MQLAAFYDIKLREIAGISYRLALDPIITGSLPQAQYVIERKMHNGPISVQSQHGKGTTFTVTLPTQRVDRPTATGI